MIRPAAGRRSSIPHPPDPYPLIPAPPDGARAPPARPAWAPEIPGGPGGGLRGGVMIPTTHNVPSSKGYTSYYIRYSCCIRDILFEFHLFGTDGKGIRTLRGAIVPGGAAGGFSPGCPLRSGAGPPPSVPPLPGGGPPGARRGGRGAGPERSRVTLGRAEKTPPGGGIPSPNAHPPGGGGSPHRTLTLRGSRVAGARWPPPGFISPPPRPPRRDPPPPPAWE